jgi:hypothetical protein
MLHETKSLYLTPTEDLAVGTLALSIVLSILTFVAVSLRCWLRLREKLFGVDDAVMLVGMLTFQSTCIVAAYSCFIGVGTHDALINSLQYSEGHKVSTTPGIPCHPKLRFSESIQVGFLHGSQ